MQKIYTIILFSFFYCASTQAQSILSVLIKTDQGDSLFNVAVSLKNTQANTSVSNYTNRQGIVVFSNLVVGEYELVILESSEYKEQSQKVTLAENESKEVIISITKNNVTTLEEVTILSTRSAQINLKDAEVSSYVTLKEIQALPMEGRDITRSLYRLPNLTIATLGYAESPNVSINGLNGIYTNYMIDGMDNNERFLGNVKFNTPIGFTKSVTVLTNNYSVEYGNTSNGIVNLETRSGSNDFTGEVFYLTRPGSSIDSKSPFANLDLSGNPVKDGFQRNQFGVGMGGAIKKNKTFYYVNVEQTYDKKDNLLNVPALGVSEIVQGNNSFTYASAKIDHYWKKNFHTSLRGNLGWFDIDRQGGGLEGGTNFPSSASRQENRTYLIAMKNQYRIGQRLQAETNFQTSYFRWNYRQPNNTTLPTVNVQDPTGRIIANLGYAGAIFDDSEYTNQIQQKFFLTKGKHSLKAGVEFTTSDFKLLAGGNPNGQYTVRLTQLQLDNVKAKNLGASLNVQDIPADVSVLSYDVELRPSVFGKTQNVFNLYLEDQYAVNKNLNVVLGLRYDYDNLSKAGGNKGDFNNLAPRTSFNYAIKGRHVIRGGYGIFYDKVKYAVQSDNLQLSNNSPDFLKQLAELQRLGILDPTADLNQITFPGNLLVRPTGPITYLNGPTAENSQGLRDNRFNTNYRIQNPNGLDNPFSHQFSLGYQYKIDDHSLFSLDIVHTETNNLYTIVDLNSPAPYKLNDPTATVTNVRTQAAANLTRPIPIVNNTATINGQVLRGVARDIFMTTTQGKAIYSAANFVLQRTKSTDSKVSYRVAYSLAFIKNNSESINTRALDANDFEAEWAYGDNDRRHVITGFLTWYPIKNFTVTPALLYQSGQPITYLARATDFGGTTDLNGNGESFGLPADRQPGEARNSGRLPDATTFDISLKYQIAIKGKPAIEISADVFNLLDAENLTGYNSTRGVSNLNQFGPSTANTLVKYSTAPLRQFQFGLRYIW